MNKNRTISDNKFGLDTRIHQGDRTTYIHGGVSVTHNYGISPENTDKRDGEDDILRRLYTSPYEDRKDRNPPRVPGTCQWFTSHELFKEWERSESSRLLWVSADPGCGKSVLVKHLVDFELQTTESRTVCYFFFKDDFPDQRSVVSALCCILRQLFIKKPLLFSEKVLQQFVTGGETFANSFSELWKILIQISKDPNAGEIIYIFDAIDECEDLGRAQLTQGLCNLYCATNSFHLKFLLTSRPYGKIHRGFRPLEIPGLPIIHLSGESEHEIMKISQEIDIFIQFKVKDIGERLQFTKKEQDFLLQELMRISNRTYLWVYLTLDLIESDIGIDQKKIAKATSCIPKSVDEAYNRILSKSHDFKQTKNILYIIVGAIRPLTLKEMNLALLLQNSHRSNDDFAKPEIRFRQELRDICGLFITIIDSKIYLLHQTAKEFLLQQNAHTHEGVRESSTWKHSLNLVKCHRTLSEICIYYLLFLEVDMNDHDGDEALCLETEDRVFIDYASKYWTVHFRELHVETQKDMTVSVLKLCDAKSRRCKMWFETYWTSKNTKFPQGFTSLMITAYFGLQTAVQYLLENDDMDINSQDYTYERSALSWAVRNGFNTITELLIGGTPFKLWTIPLFRIGPRVDLADKYGRTPLSYAVWNGNIAMVELLVNAGARVHLKDELGGTPISYAICNQNQQVLDILLQMGDQDDVEDNINDLLCSAAEKGHEEVVALLLESHRVNPNAKDPMEQTPLLYAVKEGHEEITKMLLAKGAEPNCKDNLHRTPLSYAAERGHDVILKMLLDAGAEPYFEGVHCRAPLSYAVENDRELIVNILLEREASLKAALLHATKEGNEGAALLKSEADSQPLLLWAIKKGHEAAVRSLLQNGADIQALLLWALEKGNEATVRLLLRNGADLQALLLCAIEKGNKATVSLLLSNGADLQALLLWAIEKGNEATVRLLLRNGADLQALLLWALEKRHKTTVELLLQNGADLKALLLWALEKGHTAAMGALLIGLEGAELQSLLLRAVKRDHDAMIRMWLKELEEADIRVFLLWATQLGHKAAIRALLENLEGADLKPVLLWAAERDHEAVMKALLKGLEKADLKTLLIYAAEKNPKSDDKFFIKHKMEKGNLMWYLRSAAQGSRSTLAENLLIEFDGADLKTLLLWAMEKDYQAVLKILLKGIEGAGTKALLLWAVEKDYRAVAKVLLRRLEGVGLETILIKAFEDANLDHSCFKY